MVAGESFNPESFGVLFPEEPPLVGKVNIALLKIKEEGSFLKLLNKYFSKQN